MAARRARLRDGSEVLIRPVVPEDKELIAEGFGRLSEESRYRRFLAPVSELKPSTLRYLTEVDHHDHEALVAVTPGGEGVGIARYVRLADDPRVAEAAVTVADEWQGRGLGSTLLDRLADRARAEGIDSFTALMLAENDEMRALLERLGPVREVDRAAGTVEVVAELPPTGFGQQLAALLRGSAAGLLAMLPERLPGVAAARTRPPARGARADRDRGRTP